MLLIDGSHQEGGGQIIRTALALSVLTRTPFQAVHIRKNRPKPGLKNQHISCIEALKQLTGARAEHARLGSEIVEFHPERITPAAVELDIGSAGSVPLLLQSVLLPGMFADDTVRMNITGGTDTKWSIPVDYLKNLILPAFGAAARIEVDTRKRGYYPKGQGWVEVRIRPGRFIDFSDDPDRAIRRVRRSVPELRLDRKPTVSRIKGISAASEVLKRNRVAQRQVHGAMEVLGPRCPVTIETEYQPTASVGTVITLWTEDEQGRCTIGASALGERGVPAEKIGATAAGRLMARIASGAALDHHLADNLIPLLALTGGILRPDKITGHILSNIYVCERFLNVRLTVDKNKREIHAA